MIGKQMTNQELRENVDRAKQLNESSPAWYYETIIQLHKVAIGFRDMFGVRAYRHEFMLQEWAKNPDDPRQRDLLLMYVKDTQRDLLPKLGEEYEAWATERDAKHEWPDGLL